MLTSPHSGHLVKRVLSLAILTFFSVAGLFACFFHPQQLYASIWSMTHDEARPGGSTSTRRRSFVALQGERERSTESSDGDGGGDVAAGISFELTVAVPRLEISFEGPAPSPPASPSPPADLLEQQPPAKQQPPSMLLETQGNVLSFVACGAEASKRCISEHGHRSFNCPRVPPFPRACSFVYAASVAPVAACFRCLCC